MVLSHQMLTQGLSKSPKIQFLSPSKIGFGRTTSRSSATQYGRSNLANGGNITSIVCNLKVFCWPVVSILYTILLNNVHMLEVVFSFI